jgi:hypothetical protein
MSEVHAEHRIAIMSLIVARLMWRRLRHRPDVIEATALKLDEAKKRDPNPYFDWRAIIRDPDALRQAMIGSHPNSLYARKVKPFNAADLGLDFTDEACRRRAFRKAIKLAEREMRRGRGWSISGFKIMSVYGFHETTGDRLSFDDAAERLGLDGKSVHRQMEMGGLVSLRREDVDAYPKFALEAYSRRLRDHDYPDGARGSSFTP